MTEAEKKNERLPYHLDLNQIRRMTNGQEVIAAALAVAQRIPADEALGKVSLNEAILSSFEQEGETQFAKANLKLFISELDKAWEERWSPKK